MNNFLLKLRVRVEKIVGNKSCSAIQVDPQKFFDLTLTLKNTTFSLELKVRTEGNIDNESFSVIWVDPESFLTLLQPQKEPFEFGP